MPYYPGPEAVGLAHQAQRALGLTQLELAALLGLSRRTVSRWGAHRSRPSASELQKLARAVHPKDPALAAKLAREGGETLESLGLVAAPVVAAPSLAPVVAVRPFPPARLVVESVVCASAEAMQASPASVRGVLRAAFARARGLGLTVEEIDDALTEPEEPKPATLRGKRG
jgi:transcriptional regulator with XRE-family HTH domain